MNDEAKLDAQMPNSVLSHINLDGKNRKWLRHAGNGSDSLAKDSYRHPGHSNDTKFSAER